MKEKTLRWPGHAALMRAFKETGFFSLEPIEVGGQMVRPRDLTAALLFPRWTFDEGEADLTVMRVRVEGRGREGGRRVVHAWDYLDRFDEVTGLRSMSRSTGYVATSVVRLLARGGFRRPGVHPPETLGAVPGVLESVLADLAARGVRCRATVSSLEG